MTRLPLQWVQDLDQQDKEKFEKVVRHWIASELGRKWIKIINEKINQADQRSCDYKEGWQFKQAHLNGYRLMGQELLDLMKFGEDK